jgi:hypothetical protein
MGGNCHDFIDGRTLMVNGVPETACTGSGGSWAMPLPELRLGGYCIVISAGNQSFAGFTIF